MSGHHHHHERKEMLCLNCGASLYGHYCHVCGQENNEPNESVGHLLRHFFEDLTHFDGKFFKSMKYIFSRPGFLASEYIKGHRVAYLHPVRLYLLASAIFLLLMSLLTHHRQDEVTEKVRIREEARNTDKNFGFIFTTEPGYEGNIVLLHFNRLYAVDGLRRYDSAQASLPADKRNKGFENYLERRLAAAATIYHKAPNEFMEQLTEKFIHSFSNVFLISLPLFALVLQLLYIRRKEYYFVAHAVFSIHFFCMVFAALLALLAVFYYTNGTDSEIAGIAGLTLMMLIPFATVLYLFLAMKKFYRQHWLKTLIKSLLQVSFFGVTFLLLTIIFYVNSIFNVIDVAYEFAAH